MPYIFMAFQLLPFSYFLCGEGNAFITKKKILKKMSDSLLTKTPFNGKF